ncbi:alpha/beta fold hydrolase [Marinilactibacillus sp. Marseille-P9653]|uniref:alpha/beta fold hydrolase n=1 Tax=Marinilactibacillus sp. Marseille-P9653 TaxID=2866583 RepID=UPI001CE44767|nr:alpha/beta hydrolase [Marinilactibacillus sp. Marseille-P9653]
MHETIHTKQATLSIETSGSGETLLLLHAGIADKRMWTKEVDYLSRHFQVINIDLPGFGKSEILGNCIDFTETINSVMHHYQLTEVILMAASFGGKIAIDYTLLYPDKVSKLILISPAVSGWQNSLELDDYERKEETAETVLDSIELNYQFWIERNLDKQFLSDANKNLLYDMLGNLFSKETDHVEEIEQVENSLLLLNKLELPLLMINGDHDVVDFLEIGRYMEKVVQSSKRVLIPFATHLPNFNNEKLFKKTVLSFLIDHNNQ